MSEVSQTPPPLLNQNNIDDKGANKYNAQKHGLLTKVILIRGESQEVLNEFEQKSKEDLKPITEIEELLVGRIISNAWRLRRAMRVEQEIFETHYDTKIGGVNFGQAFRIESTTSNTIDNFIRYEASIERALYRALHELQRLQATRKGEKTPPPIVIDIDSHKQD